MIEPDRSVLDNPVNLDYRRKRQALVFLARHPRVLRGARELREPDSVPELNRALDEIERELFEQQEN